MKAWTVVTGIFTVTAVAFTVVFFLASVGEFSNRDLIVVALGFFSGAALAATVVFLIVGHRMDAVVDPVKLKKAELLGTIQTRAERLGEISQSLIRVRIQAAESQGNIETNHLNAREAIGHRMAPVASELMANAKGWMIALEGQTVEMAELIAQKERLESITDEEFLTEQKRLKGLD
jgi:hypothetical protein